MIQRNLESVKRWWPRELILSPQPVHRCRPSRNACIRIIILPMTSRPLRTTVIGSYPFPGWLEFASANLSQFGAADIAEAQDDAVICAIHDQMAAGLDVITDGEQTRLDFNLSFYGYLEGIELEG